ncbi:MAG: 23S rRNA (pseudouridine(1915)-N(3))-methyltransferase RlmH [Bacteroidota bacterium]|nr:23S rRNA (pseudouridine(1915)-N(3))-methyltransferase RlmH [Bacteroidota bacterium]
MKLILLVVGKTTESWAKTAIAEYESRLKHYLPFRIEVIPDLKSTKHLTEEQIKSREAEAILAWNKPGDTMVLLDERGESYTSEGFASYLQKKMNTGIRQLIVVIGGPYGFAPSVYEAVPERISLSKMTFSHQMVRLFAVEQCYRAMTILNNEPYHHS